MLPRKIFLRDRNPTVVRAWREVFAEVEPVDASDADFFDQPADAIVSPANSFGNMDGGLDLAIRDRIGGDIQEMVQEMILRDYHGEILVGSAEIVPTGNDSWPHLVVAPTMRVPESVSATAFAAEQATPTYVPGPTLDPIGWSPSGQPRYTYFYATGAVGAASASAATAFTLPSSVVAPTSCTSAPTTGGNAVAASATVGTTPAGFTAGAQGNVESDATCDDWFINDQRSLTTTRNDVGA